MLKITMTFIYCIGLFGVKYFTTKTKVQIKIVSVAAVSVLFWQHESWQTVDLRIVWASPNECVLSLNFHTYWYLKHQGLCHNFFHNIQLGKD
jgi:hypothetical protein